MKKIILLFIFVFALNGQASQCPYKPEKEVLAASKTVFIGTVLSNDGKIAVLSVDKNFKGNLGKKIEVKFTDRRNTWHNDIKKFRVGDEFIVTSTHEVANDKLELNFCGYSTLASSAPHILKELESLKPNK